MSSSSDAPAAPPRADPRKAFRGPASATLTMEIITVPLSLLVMAKSDAGLTVVGVGLVVLLTLGLIAALALVGRSWGLAYVLGLQVVMVAGWAVSPALGVMGVIFLLVWLLLLWLRHEVLRRQALWPAPADGA